jgi:hypothetical protein
VHGRLFGGALLKFLDENSGYVIHVWFLFALWLGVQTQSVIRMRNTYRNLIISDRIDIMFGNQLSEVYYTRIHEFAHVVARIVSTFESGIITSNSS